LCEVVVGSASRRTVGMAARGMKPKTSLPVPLSNLSAAELYWPASKACSMPSLAPTMSILRRSRCLAAKSW
jgi:hypothetical protein